MHKADPYREEIGLVVSGELLFAAQTFSGDYGGEAKVCGAGAVLVG